MCFPYLGVKAGRYNCFPVVGQILVEKGVFVSSGFERKVFSTGWLEKVEAQYHIVFVG